MLQRYCPTCLQRHPVLCIFDLLAREALLRHLPVQASTRLQRLPSCPAEAIYYRICQVEQPLKSRILPKIEHVLFQIRLEVRQVDQLPYEVRPRDRLRKLDGQADQL